MLAKFSGLNPKGPYQSLEKEKKNLCVVLTYFIKRAREVSCRIRTTAVKKCRKKRDARAKLFSCTKPIFLLFADAVAKTPCCCDQEILLPW